MVTPEEKSERGLFAVVGVINLIFVTVLGLNADFSKAPSVINKIKSVLHMPVKNPVKNVGVPSKTKDLPFVFEGVKGEKPGSDLSKKAEKTLWDAVEVLSRTSTGKHLLSTIKDLHYTVIFDDKKLGKKNAVGMQEGGIKRITLSTHQDRDDLALTLDHEIRHAEQDGRDDLKPLKSSTHPNKAMLVGLALEADARTHEAIVALELAHEKFDHSLLHAFIAKRPISAEAALNAYIEPGDFNASKKAAIMAAVFTNYYHDKNTREHYEGHYLELNKKEKYAADASGTSASDSTFVQKGQPVNLQDEFSQVASQTKEKVKHQGRPYLITAQPDLNLATAQYAGITPGAKDKLALIGRAQDSKSVVTYSEEKEDPTEQRMQLLKEIFFSKVHKNDPVYQWQQGFINLDTAKVRRAIELGMDVNIPDAEHSSQHPVASLISDNDMHVDTPKKYKAVSKITDLILEAGTDLTKPYLSFSARLPSDWLFSESRDRFDIENRAKVVMATIEQHFDNNLSAYEINFDSIFDGIGGGPYSQTRVDTMNNIAKIHDYVRSRLENPQTPLEKRLVQKHAGAISFWTTPFQKPDLAELPFPPANPSNENLPLLEHLNMNGAARYG